MDNFFSFAHQLSLICKSVVKDHSAHARWLNTMAYLEHCGAKKIARCHHPLDVNESFLKHAAEEFRHAHFLKKQICKVSAYPLEDFSKKYLLGGIASIRYLDNLDYKICRILKGNVAYEAIKSYAYFLVTYSIERRAKELYPIYQQTLFSAGTRIYVNSIILEEEEHLAEMEEVLLDLPKGKDLMRESLRVESLCCEKWLLAVMRDLS